MHPYLKDRQSYEDTYDRHTVEICRKNEQMLLDVFLAGVEKVLPELAESPVTKEGRDPIDELARVHHTFHYFYIYYNAGERWKEREKTIAEWMAKDESKDLQLQNARLTTEPVCQHCSKTGLRIISKDLMRRGDDYKWDGPRRSADYAELYTLQQEQRILGGRQPLGTNPYLLP